MNSNSQCPFLKETLETPNDGLSIKVTVELLVKASLHVCTSFFEDH